MSGEVVTKRWKRKVGFVSEHKIDARWVLYADGDPKPQGSLRIVSHPDLPPGHVRAHCAIVIKRTPKSPEEIADTVINHDIAQEELELYSIDEHLELWVTQDKGPLYQLEKTYGVKVFG
jgi:hypothetical protein